MNSATYLLDPDAIQLPSIVRQPICDRDVQVGGYQLLAQTEVGSAHTLTAEALVEHGLPLVRHGMGWIPVSLDLCLSPALLKLPADRFVLMPAPEVLSSDRAHGALVALREHGFAIAIEARVGAPVMYGLADWIIVDAALEEHDLRELIRAVPARRRPLRVMAKGIDTYDRFELCKTLDIDLFQGCFFTRTPLSDGKGIRVNTAVKLKFIADLYNPNVGLERLNAIVSADLALSHGLLRHVNSAWLAVPRQIESVQHATVMLGVHQVRHWLTTMALADSSDTSDELLTTGLVRAQMMERIARARAIRRDQESYFTVGLFSVVDQITGTPLGELLEQLPLSESVKNALLHHDGPLGSMLSAMKDYEIGKFDPLFTFVPEGTKPATFYRESIEWVEEVRGTLTAAPEMPAALEPAATRATRPIRAPRALQRRPSTRPRVVPPRS